MEIVAECLEMEIGEADSGSGYGGGESSSAVNSNVLRFISIERGCCCE